MSPSLPSHDTRRRDALSIDSLVDRPSTRQCGKCQEAQTRCDGREPCRNCEVRGTLCGYAWSSFSAPHTLPPLQQAPAQHYPAQFGAPPAKRRSPVPTGSIFPRSSALDGGWAIVPQGTNAPTAHPPGPVVSCKTCQARNTQCDGVTPVCGSCRMRRLECYLATPASTNNMRNGTTTMTWSARDRQALNPRSFPPSLSQAAMLAPPSRPRAPSDASKPSSSRSSLSFMLNPKPEGKVASGSKENAQRPTELKVTPTHHVTTPTHHVTPPTPVAPVSMEKAQAMDVDPPVRDPPASPSSSTGGATLSRRPSRKRSASPESHYGREDSPSRESVSSLGLSALGMSERRNRALSHIHSPRSSIESHARRQALEPHSPRGSTDFDPRNSIDSHVRSSMDHSRSHSARGSIDSHSHSPTRSARNSIDSHPFSSRGQPLDEAHSTRVFNHSVDSLSNSHRSTDPPSRPVDYPNRPADPHSDLPVDPHPADAHTRRSIHPQGLASPSDPNRPRSRSKSSLSHLLDGGGYGGMTSSAQVSPTHTVPASPVQSKSPVYTMGSSTSPIHTQASLTRATDNKSPIHTTHPPNHGRPPRTPVSELGPGPSPTATHGPGPSPKSSGPGHSPKAHGPGPSPTSAYGPARSPTATSTSEPFSRPMSADSSIRPVSADSFSRPQSVHREANPGVHRDSIPPAHPHPPKQTSISTALADMQLKSAGTSRASSPGGHIHGYTRDVFVHSAFNGANTRHYPNWTFGTVGENMADGRKPGMANVWRHETEAGMRRREAEAELRKQDQVELQRRRSEGGAKRRKLGEAEAEDPERERDRERRMSVVAEERRMLAVEPEKSDRRMSIAESERRMSIVEPENKTFAEPEKRAIESEKRMSGVEIERKTSISEPGRRMSIVEHVRRVTEVQNAKEAGNRTTHSLPDPRGTTTDVFARSRRGSAPMLGGWIDEKQSVIVISDSPELDTADTEMNIPDKSEKLFPERTVPDSTSPVATEGSSRSVDQTTPLAPFGHIWPVPVIDSGKKTRRPKDSEPAPTRSFITPLNLPPPPPTTQVKQLTPVVDDEAKDKDKDKDKEAGSNQPSVLRSMLTTMPPRATFVAAVQNFLSQPATKTRRNRAVIMTKSLMRDALGVLLDPNTDELLKDYVPPEKKKDDEKLDGTRRKMSITIDTTDHTSLEFRAWAKRMFSTVKTTRGEDVLAFDGKPVVVEDDIYETIVICHSQGNHCSTEETAKLVDQEHSWVPRALIEAFVQKCPGCPLENKTISTTTKPKKRKSVRGSSAAAAAAGPKRKPMITRRKKTQDGESLRRSRKSSGKEASPEESDVEEGDQEEDELKESGDEAGPADVKTDDPEPEPAGEDQDQDQDQDEGEPEQEPEPEPDADEPDEAEEPEMESEDELVSRPSPMGRKSGT